MSQIALSYGANERSNFPPLSALNVIAEPNPTVSKLAILGRPTLAVFATAGTGPIRGVFQKSGLFSDAAVVVSGENVYLVAINGIVTLCTGTVPGFEIVDLDGAVNTSGTTSVDEVRIATGSGLYLLTGTTVAAETFPDDAGVTSIMALRGFWFAVRADSQIGYIKIPGGSWQALDAVSAEKQPDALLSVWPLGDLTVFLGAASIEGWAFTGTASPPIAPVPGQTFDHVGLLSKAAVTSNDSALYFVGSDFAVYEYATYPKAVSDFALNEIIRNTDPSMIRMGSLNLGQHNYIILRLASDATWVLDLATRIWSPWASKGLAYFKPHLFSQIGGRALAFDSSTGQVWTMTPGGMSDEEDEVIRRFTGVVSLNGGEGFADSISLDVKVGGGLVSGQGSDPQIGLEVSYDQGGEWTPPVWEPLGRMGSYETRVIWRGFGQFDAPGLLLRWTLSDPVALRVSAAWLNED